MEPGMLGSSPVPIRSSSRKSSYRQQHGPFSINPRGAIIPAKRTHENTCFGVKRHAGSYNKANTKWSLLLRQCEQRTRGAIRSLGRGIPGTRAALFSGPGLSFAKKTERNATRRPPIQARLAGLLFIVHLHAT
jgi:hypothetical protein